MSFDVSADAYAGFMGRYSQPLAAALLELLELTPGQRLLDVGCGPGAFAAAAVDVLGAAAVVGVDPAQGFVQAASKRLGIPSVVGVAEQLPFVRGHFDVAVAQLVVHFMRDPVAGLREMHRVTAPGGSVVASVWDHGTGAGPLGTFWRAARDVDPSVGDESTLPGVAEGALRSLYEAAGLAVTTDTSITVGVGHPGFDEWWEPFTLGVGPAGAYVARLSDQAREHLRERCRELLPAGAFTVEARAWTVVGR